MGVESEREEESAKDKIETGRTDDVGLRWGDQETWRQGKGQLCQIDLSTCHKRNWLLNLGDTDFVKNIL